MKYYRPIELQNYDVIKRKALEFALADPGTRSNKIFWNPLNLVDFSRAVPELNAALSVFGMSATYIAAIVKSTLIPGTIHIDGMATGHGACVARLQLPLWNTEGSATKFYRSDSEVEKRFNAAGTPYLHIDQESCVEVDSVEILQPTIIRIDVPHTVIAGPRLPRITLTVKLSKDPAFMLEDDYAAV
jgi:hypothetical protein